jgi:hypothetical protein
MTPEAMPVKTETQTTTTPAPKGTIGETRKDKNGTTWTFDGTGWYHETTDGGSNG